MKNLKQYAVTILFGAIACSGLHAQTVDLQATIPFDFTVGQTLMPAGEYEVLSQGQGVIVRRTDRSKSVCVMTMPSSVGTAGTPRLSFHRYGDEYFLTAIRNPWSGAAREIPQTRRETVLGQRVGGTIEATIVARNNVHNSK